MSSNNPKRQHYIPQFLLRNFYNSEGYFWMGDTKTGCVWKAKPHDSFVEKDLYTTHVYDPDTGALTRKDYSYERDLQEFESPTAPVIRNIMEKVRSKKCPELSEEDSDTIKRFVFSMARRTRESQQKVMSSNNCKDIFYEAAKECAEQKNHPLPDKDSFYQDRETVRLMEKVEHNVDARFAAGEDSHFTQQEEKFCRETGLSFVVIGIPKRSFVIGSHGITIFKTGENKQSCLPISHDAVVVVSPHPGKETLATLGRDKDWLTRKTNMATAHQSRWTAGCSEQLMRSLVC